MAGLLVLWLGVGGTKGEGEAPVLKSDRASGSFVLADGESDVIPFLNVGAPCLFSCFTAANLLFVCFLEMS